MENTNIYYIQKILHQMNIIVENLFICCQVKIDTLTVCWQVSTDTGIQEVQITREIVEYMQFCL